MHDFRFMSSYSGTLNSEGFVHFLLGLLVRNNQSTRFYTYLFFILLLRPMNTHTHIHQHGIFCVFLSSLHQTYQNTAAVLSQSNSAGMEGAHPVQSSASRAHFRHMPLACVCVCVAVVTASPHDQRSYLYPDTASTHSPPPLDWV